MAQAGSAKAPSRRPPSNPREVVQRSTSPSRQSFSPDRILAALRTLPSHGSISGWTGRRDRALLVLSQMAGLSFENISELTVGDIHIADGVATIRTPGGTTTLHQTDDGLICGPCTLARWVHALDLRSVYSNSRVIAAVIARAAPLTVDSPHLCQGTINVTETTRQLPVLPSVDQWGPFPVAPPAPNPTARRAPVRGVTVSGDTVSRIPVQFTSNMLPKATGPCWPSRSNYTRADRELSVAEVERLALGLECRAQQLLDRRSGDGPAH